MKEKIENISFKYRVTTLTFIIFLIISLLSPISGADWKSYVIGKGGLSSCINKAKENLSQFVCTLSADNNPKRYIQITFKDSFMYTSVRDKITVQTVQVVLTFPHAQATHQACCRRSNTQ